MKERQLFSKANFGKITKGTGGGKLILNAKDYDFELRLDKLVGDKDFSEGVVIPVRREELFGGFVKGVLDPFVEFYNRVKYKVKEIVTDTTFADIRYTFRSLYAVRLTGAYKISDGMRNRSTILRVYKLADWDEKKAFMKDPSAFNASIVGVYEFEPLMLSRGAFSYDDIVTIEELITTCEDAYFKRSQPYNNYLDEVRAEKGDTNAQAGLGHSTSGNNGYTGHYKPKAVIESDIITVESDDEEYPF